MHTLSLRVLCTVTHFPASRQDTLHARKQRHKCTAITDHQPKTSRPCQTAGFPTQLRDAAVPHLGPEVRT